MATKTIARGGARRAAEIPVRKISMEDLSLSLRQGLDDFLTFRGDIVFAGLVYTVIGIAAVVMTTSMPLMPFFFPVVAVAGLLLLIFFLWLLAAGALDAALLNLATPTSIPQFLAIVLFTPRGWALIA